MYKNEVYRAASEEEEQSEEKQRSRISKYKGTSERKEVLLMSTQDCTLIPVQVMLLAFMYRKENQVRLIH